MSLSDRDLLVAVRERIARGLARCAMARNGHGTPVDYSSADAVAWCVTGACWAATDSARTAGRVAGLLGFGTHYSGRDRPVLHMEKWNDASTQAEVLARIDAALARAESGGSGER